MNIGLALSGGGIRGTSHIGALKVFERYNIKPNLIAGTSAGSIFAALYSLGYSAKEMEYIALEMKNFVDIDYADILHSILSPKKKMIGLLKGKNLEYLLMKYLGHTKINQTQIPIGITSVDINHAKEVVFSSQNIYRLPPDYINISNIELYKAVRASCSLPLIYRPVSINHNGSTLTLVDGGILENLPIETLKCMNAYKIIGINLGYNGYLKANIDNGFEVLSQAMDIMGYEISRLKSEMYYKNAYVYNPEIWDVGLFDSNKIKECIQRGEKAAAKNIKNIIKYLES